MKLFLVCMWIGSSIPTAIFVAEGLRYVKHTGIASMLFFVALDALIKIGATVAFLLAEDYT